MPIARYNRAFGGKKGSAAEALAAMQSQYGTKKGTSVFYALTNKRGIPSVRTRRRRKRR